MFSPMQMDRMSSTKLIQRLKKNNPDSITVEEIGEVHKIISEMPELEGYRVMVWLCVGPLCHTKMARALMDHLGKDDPLYDKVLRWLHCKSYDPTSHKTTDVEGVRAHEANGFKYMWDLLNTTKELVSCV